MLGNAENSLLNWGSSSLSPARSLARARSTSRRADSAVASGRALPVAPGPLSPGFAVTEVLTAAAGVQGEEEEAALRALRARPRRLDGRRDARKAHAALQAAEML